jgi:hypothetical protein
MAHNNPRLKAPTPLRALRAAKLILVVNVALPSIGSAQLVGHARTPRPRVLTKCDQRPRR